MKGITLAAMVIGPTHFASANGVVIVDAPGLGVMPDIQTAVDAAVNGDVLLVGGGSYPPFTIDGKTLYVFAMPGNAATVAGTVEIRNLGPGKRVVLHDIVATGAATPGVSQPALVLTANSGHIRLQRCTFNGGDGVVGTCGSNGAGGTAVELVDSARVAFTRCMVVGGRGTPFLSGGASTGCLGAAGGDALNSDGSAFAMYDCTLIGGNGGVNGALGGDGGRGAFVADFGVFASGCLFRGGRGGNAVNVPRPPQHAGNGGDALNY